MYNYERTAKKAKFNPSAPYERALTDIQMQFVGGLGEGLANYINTVTRRRSQSANWTWGFPKSRGVGVYSLNVYNEMQMGALPPTTITLYVKFDKTIEVVARGDDGSTPLNKKFNFGTSAGQAALAVGAGWEKLTTGTVDYGH